MLILKTAIKNILAAGKRTWLNATVLSFVLVLMIAYNGLLDGWVEQSRTDIIDWQVGSGQLWNANYDPYDVFTLEQSHAVVPQQFTSYVRNGSLVPVLVVQASVYPQNRLMNVTLNGISPAQTVVKIPSTMLTSSDTTVISAVVGAAMAKASKLSKGDRVMLQWRDRNGVFDAQEILIADVFRSNVPQVENNQIWLNINDLYKMTGLVGEATYFIEGKDCSIVSNTDDWQYKSVQTLTQDIDDLIASKRIGTTLIFGILLAIALLAVFDTQVLSIFRRQREIGTLVALGMTPKRVSRLFTLEGICYTLLAIGVSVVWGVPFLIWFYLHGYPVPDTFDGVTTGMGTAMYPAFKLSSIMITILILLFFAAIVSWLPARKIAKQNIILALKNKL